MVTLSWLVLRSANVFLYAMVGSVGRFRLFPDGWGECIANLGALCTYHEPKRTFWMQSIQARERDTGFGMEAKQVTQTHHNFFEGGEQTPIKIRGLHLDPCRHFLQVDTVLRIIDKMAALRLNTLHLHLSDDQGFPVQFKKYPEVQSDPQWTIEDQERIARRCREHNIQVIPEIDIPGHVRAFLSFFDDSIEPERQMGVITHETIDMERDLPVIFGMFEELVERFDASFIHMGGDEVPSFDRFPELIEKVCTWAAERGLEVIAWDDVLSEIDDIPDNLVIQQWRGHKKIDPKLSQVRTILSRGYYLDHAKDPFRYYDADPMLGKQHLGCIACMWTELVTDQTVECTIFPSLYLIAHRWWTYPHRENAVPSLLRQLCEHYGYPAAALDDWRTRRWVGFYRDDPRSTSSVTVDDVLDREHDLVPTFSRSLVVVSDMLYRWLQHGEVPVEEEKELFLQMAQDCYGEDFSFLFEKPKRWEQSLATRMKKTPSSDLFNNGLKAAIRQARRS
ncbi:MAG: hypothetical protein EP343_03225 [Deltaproteobacteria bacterium]|nr:MAG: hypothetical protein EP343_03225 [Deltaproteobacteria bacterium]